MISQDLINTRLGLILSRLGKQVSNAALYKQELGEACPSDQAILDEYENLLAEEAAARPLPYQAARLQAYNEAGLTAEAWSLARVQVELDHQFELWDDMIAKRDAIKQRIPKP